MSMRLLPKSEVTRQKAVERKTEIDEGLKLARRIDGMRETLAKEENELSKFRGEVVPFVTKEIDALIQTKASLELDVADLKKFRKELQKPLDAKWEKVKEREVKLDNKYRDLDEEINLIVYREENLSQHEKQLAIEKERVSDEKKRSSSALVEASETLAQARESSIEADRKLAETDVYCENREKTLLARETELAERERENDLRYHSLTAKEKEINLREKFINDKYQTLLRAQNYVSRKRVTRPK